MTLRSAFPDCRMTVEDVVAEGDQVAYRWTFSGTHRGELRGIAATGKRVSISGINVDRIAHGKIAEHWSQADVLGLLQQLGAVPGGGGAQGQEARGQAEGAQTR
jgi:steroid delta-isomerase-like uncharacterized protein